MRMSDWSSDVCSSDLLVAAELRDVQLLIFLVQRRLRQLDRIAHRVGDDGRHRGANGAFRQWLYIIGDVIALGDQVRGLLGALVQILELREIILGIAARRRFSELALDRAIGVLRSEEHTSELQSLMRISYAVFCLN